MTDQYRAIPHDNPPITKPIGLVLRALKGDPEAIKELGPELWPQDESTTEERDK